MNVDLNGCISGRKDSWDAFVKQTAGLIFAAVQRTMRGRGAAALIGNEIEDRVQDVYIKLLQDDCRLLKTFDPARASLSTWLTLVARSTTRDAMLRKKLETIALSDADGARIASPHQNGTVHHTLEVPGFDALTDRQRDVLRMLFDESMTVEQAAARLGVDPQTIRSTKHKALVRLRSHAGADKDAEG